jgi:hypothetical protein
MPYYSTSTFRIVGNAATTQSLFTIENGTGSGKVVSIYRLNFLMDATALLAAVMPQIKTSRAGATSAGTALTKTRFDLNDSTSAALIVCRGANASDGGSATAITVTPGDLLWQQLGMRLHTVVGQVIGGDNNVLPALVESQPVVLREGQSVVCHVVAAAGTSNPATNHYIIECVWGEV